MNTMTCNRTGQEKEWIRMNVTYSHTIPLPPPPPHNNKTKTTTTKKQQQLLFKCNRTEYILIPLDLTILTIHP